MRIDVHAHYWAASYLDLLVSLGRNDLRHVGRQRDDFDDRLRLLDEQGVDLQLLSAIGVNTELPDAASASVAACHINDLYVQLIDRYPRRFGAFASVPLPHVDAAIAESDRALDQLGLTGIALPCVVGGKPIDHDDYAEFWRNLGERGTPTAVYVHPAGDDSLCHPGLDRFGLNMALGSPMQIAMASLRIALSGLSTRYPGLRFTFALCGGVLPYLWDRYERNLRRGIEMSAVAASGADFFAWMKQITIDPADPMALLRSFWYDTSVQDIPTALELATRTFGADRLVLGSDEIFASLAESIAGVEASPHLTAEQKHRVLDVNAAEMLGLLDAVPASTVSTPVTAGAAR